MMSMLKTMEIIGDICVQIMHKGVGKALDRIIDQWNAEKAVVAWRKAKERRHSYAISVTQDISISDGHTRSRITYTPGDSAANDMRAAVIVME